MLEIDEFDPKRHPKSLVSIYSTCTEILHVKILKNSFFDGFWTLVHKDETSTSQSFKKTSIFIRKILVCDKYVRNSCHYHFTEADKKARFMSELGAFSNGLYNLI